MKFIIDRKTAIADNITLFELQPASDTGLPDFTPGAHVAVTVPGGLVRKYSLCNKPGDRGMYRFAVKREAAGGGGSRALVDGSQVGDTLDVGEPHNDFPLDDTAADFVFIAGGIGITPIYAMMKHLDELGRGYTLYYFTRTEADAAFRDDLIHPGAGRQIVLHHDGGDPRMGLDLGALLANRPEGAHLYCCGPRPLMDAVRAAAGHWASGSIHFEDFGREAAVADGDQPFDVRLARSDRVITVTAQQTMMEAIRDAGIAMPSSCETGTCGTCRTALLAGVADHRDLVLFDDEYNDFIIPCVSRAKTPEITIDL
jgi:phthalate 4,5-dioxygenase reductase subunit